MRCWAGTALLEEHYRCFFSDCGMPFFLLSLENDMLENRVVGISVNTVYITLKKKFNSEFGNNKKTD